METQEFQVSVPMGRLCGTRAVAQEEARDDHSELMWHKGARLDSQIWAAWSRNEIFRIFLGP